MNILITAGGTAEKIDDVRQLTNQATGRLGKVIAETLLKNEDIHLLYVYGPNAVLPETTAEAIQFFPIRSVEELKQQMQQLFSSKTIDYVIHSMAVSDYKLNFALSGDDLVRSLATELTSFDHLNQREKEAALKTILFKNRDHSQPQAKKMSSDSEHLVLCLDRAPKVIHFIKQWQPTTKLIGFKLLIGVSEDQLIHVAQQSLTKNQADFIIANDLENITDTLHPALLVNKEGVVARFKTRQEIALGLQSLIKNRKEVI